MSERTRPAASNEAGLEKTGQDVSTASLRPDTDIDRDATLATDRLDAYVARLISEAPPLDPAQRDVILAAFARMRPARQRAA